FVAFGAAQTAGFLEIGLSEPAAGALDVNATARLLDLLRRAQAKQKVRERKTGGIIDPFGFSALFAEVHLLHFFARDLSQVNSGLFFFADAAQHKFSLLYSYIGSPETLVKARYWATSFWVIAPG